MIKKFIEIAEQVETIVQVIPRDPIAISKTLTSIIDDDSGVVISKLRFVNAELLNEFAKQNKNIKYNPTDEELANTKYGITDAFAGIAETGSVCVLNNNSMSGSFSLFTKIHIAILESKNIVTRPRDIFLSEPFKEITMNEDFIFVSGSSATADMGPLVRGVHGPAKLYVLIIN